MSAVSSRAADVVAPARRLPGRTVASVRSTPLVLAILLIIAAAHGTAWTIATAPWNGPDEVQHFAYAEHLAETGHAPQRNRGDGSQSTAQNVALIGLNLLPIRLQPGARPTPSALPRIKAGLAKLPASARKNGSGPNSAANYPPLYYAYEAVAYKLSPWRSELGRLFVMRLATVLLLVVTVGLTWAIAGEVLALGWAQTMATAMVALQPKLGFGSGIVNPDLMLVVLATGALLAAIRLVRRGPSTGRVVALAACSAAAILTHPRGYFLAPFAVIALTITAWRFRDGLRRTLITATVATITLIGSVLLATMWVRGHTAGTGSSGTGNPPIAINPRQFLSYLWQFYLPKLSFMAPKVGPSFYGYRQVYIESFFGNFASLSVNFRPMFYDWMQVFAGIGLVGLYTTIVARWRAVHANWPVAALAVVFFGGLMALLHVVSYSSLRGSPDVVITGRYLLPAVALYGVAAAWVVSSLPRRIGLPLAGIILGLTALAAVAGVGLSMERFYV
jgi:4-amino-4-deoxy-L-arabinose transferase-like glycosyltransferase